MNRRVDYIPLDLGNGLALVRKYEMRGKIVPLKDNHIKKAGLYAMFSQKTINSDFVEKFSAELASFKETPAYDKLFNEYFTITEFKTP